MWPRSRRHSDHWISVVFSPGRIDVAEIQRRAGERPAVTAWEPYAADGELAGLKRLRGRLNGRCTTLLRHGQYQMLQVESPQVPREERREALRWRIKEMVDFPVDRAGIDVIDIPTPPGGGGGRPPQAYAVVASHDVLAPRVQLFQDAKVELAAIDIPELAQRNVAALFEQEHRGLALLAFDADGGRLTFTYEGELYAVRHIDVASRDLTAAADALPGIYERVLLDVQRSLDNFDRNFSFISLAKLLVAPVPGAAAFVEYLRGNLYQTVELLDLAQGMDIARVPALSAPERQAEALLSLGAALREDAPGAAAS